MEAWLQILAEGQNLDPVVTQVVHHRFHFLDRFPKPQHESRFGGYA